MRKIAFILSSVCVFVLFIGCTSPHEYDSIEELYQASLTAIKSKDKAHIQKFVTAILPNKSSAEYMKKNNCVYRGFPEALKKYPNAIDNAIVLNAERFYSFALYLEREYGNLDKLQFIGFERAISPEPLNESGCECQDVLFENIWIKVAFSHRNDAITYSFGELLKVNGKWKAFSQLKHAWISGKKASQQE